MNNYKSLSCILYLLHYSVMETYLVFRPEFFQVNSEGDSVWKHFFQDGFFMNIDVDGAGSSPQCKRGRQQLT